MEIEILEKAVRLAGEINNLNEYKEDLNNIRQRKEFIFEILNGYNSQILEEKIKEYEEELNKI